MQMGIGIDLVSHEEVRDAVRRHGRRYLERVYTRRELEECRGDASRLAVRFAAKEAAMKALQRQHEAIAWHSIELRGAKRGSPSLELTGAAAALAHRRGLRTFSVSLTQTTTSAAAVVLAQG
jgi:holo-[acyl-carrier protein] synthase